MSHEVNQPGKLQHCKHYLKQKRIWKTHLTKRQKVQDYVFKAIVHPKMKIVCVSAYPQGIQDVGDFVSSVEHKLSLLTQTVAVCQSYNGSQWEKKKHTQTNPN